MDTETVKSPPDTGVPAGDPTSSTAVVEDVIKAGSENKEGDTSSLKEPVEEDVISDGHSAAAHEAEAAKSADVAAAEDTEMKDATEPVEAPSQDAATPSVPSNTNGTPAGSKRASVGGSSKKKTSSVPEHKKKLKSKKSRPLTHLDAQPGEYYFARMKGHPWWPSIVCDEPMLPHSLLSTRPVTAALPDGSFKREDYAPGGKRAYERTFPIMFLHTNEFAWIPNTELNPLDPASDVVQNFPEKGKTKQLIAAYDTAKQGKDLEAFKTMLLEHEKAIQDDLALQEERAAKKVEKAKRAAARKDTEAKNDDDMDVDEPASAEKTKTKKRKKTGDDIDEDEKPAKTPKTTTKLKLSTPRQPAESAPKKSAAKAKPKAGKSPSDEETQPAKVEEKLTPAEIRENKEKKVLYFRHKLQRGFLSRDATIKEEEMEQMSQFLKDLQEHTDLEAEIIRNTKIHKVLKQMIKLDNIPREEEFGFKDRASDLLAHWNDTLAKDTPAEEAAKPAPEGGKATDIADEKSTPAPTPAEEPAPTTNGQAEPKEEKAAEVVQEEQSAEGDATTVAAAADEVEAGSDKEEATPVVNGSSAAEETAKTTVAEPAPVTTQVETVEASA